MASLSALIGPATAHQSGQRLHLSDAPSDQRVAAIRYCDGKYEVVTQDGTPLSYPEFDLRFKTDSGANGPPPGVPVIIKAGMGDDRAFVIFRDPQDISGVIKKTC